jgi:O-succinylbenzoic acid--CoA ligase
MTGATPDRSLSIRAAAAERPDAPFLFTATRTFTFAETVAALPPPRDVVTAHPTAETLLAILSAIDAGRPVAIAHPARTAPDLSGTPETLAVLQTSGSTGAPRPIALSRRHCLAAAAAVGTHLGERDDDRWLLCLPLAHTGGLALALRCLVARRPIVMHEGSFHAGEVARLGVARGVTCASLVPTQLDALVASGAPLPAWRAVVVGGAEAARPVLERAAARGVPFLTSYGLTETWGQVATARPADAGRVDAPMVPLPGVTITGGTAAAPASLAITGPMVDGTLVTADLGWVDDAGVHVAGRGDDVIITGGENVHPAEVERALASAPGVAAACAFGVPDERWGQLVAAAIVPGERLDLAALHAWLAAHLPAHLRPRRLAVLDTLPLLPSGKIDRRALARQLASPS